MARRDVANIARPELVLRPILHADGHATGDDVADVGLLAPFRLDDGLHVGGPAPARLNHAFADHAAWKSHKRRLSQLEAERLVRVVEALALRPHYDTACSSGIS